MLMSQVQIPLPPPKIKTHSLLAVGFFLAASALHNQAARGTNFVFFPFFLVTARLI
jgi:hypothetical protein